MTSREAPLTPNNPEPLTAEDAWAAAWSAIRDFDHWRTVEEFRLLAQEVGLGLDAARAHPDPEASPDPSTALDVALREFGPGDWSYRPSFPGGQRWTVTDDSNTDNDVWAVFDTEAEAKAAVYVVNRILDVLRDAARASQPVPAVPEDTP